MGPHDDTSGGKDRNGIAPEQISILITIIGFLLMIAGISITNEVFNLYFSIGLVIVIIGVCFFGLFIWARVYSISHFPVPIPAFVKEMLQSGALRRQPVQAQPERAFDPRPTYQTSPTVGTQLISQPAAATSSFQQSSPQQSSSQSSPMFTAPAPAQPQPQQQPAVPQYQPATAKVTDIPVQPSMATASVPQPATQPAFQPFPQQTPSSPTRPQPEPRKEKEQFVDVLEEADREFESYIDKLIEE